MNRVNKIKEDAPELLDNQEVMDAAMQADKLHDLKALYDTPGGKALVKQLLSSTRSHIFNLIATYKTASDIELRARIAAIDTELNVARVLINAQEGLEVLEQELTDILSE